MEHTDVLHFGSFFACSDKGVKTICKLLQKADPQTIIVYDPNYRKVDQTDHKKIVRRALRYLKKVDILKASQEDMLNLFGTSNLRQIMTFLSPFRIPLTVITMGSEGSTAFSGKTIVTVEAPEIAVEDTIGAGDNYTAGLLHKWSLMGFKKSDLGQLNPKDLETILTYAGKLAASCCKTRGAGLTRGMLKQIV